MKGVEATFSHSIFLDNKGVYNVRKNVTMLLNCFGENVVVLLRTSPNSERFAFLS
jgi:hypothetical protein